MMQKIKEIKLAVISGFYPGGGVVTYVKNIYPQLKKSKFLDIHLFLDSPNKEYDKEIRNSFPKEINLNIFRVPPLRFVRGLFFVIKFLLKIKFKKFSFVMVHHTSYANILHTFIPKEKLVIMTEGPDVLDERMNNFFYRSLAKRAYQKARAIFTHTHQEVDKLISLGVEKEKITFFPVGVDIDGMKNFKKTNLRNELGIKNKYVLCTTYGKNYKRKGTHFLLKALPEIMEQDIAVILTGQMSEEILPLVRGLEKKYVKRFFWIGFRNDIPNVLSNSDIYILPSLIEGMSVSLLEAMAAGKACISTRSVGENELSLGKAGILINPGSSKEISDAVIKLVENPKLIKKYSQLAKKQVEKFSWDKVAKNKEDLIKKMFKKRVSIT